MRARMLDLLSAAQHGGYAVGAFNVYNLEGVQAVIAAAEAESSPVILQIHPKALLHGGAPLIVLCQTAADEARVPAAVHLDHSASAEAIERALHLGITSVMADGAGLSYADNVIFSRAMVALAHKHGASVEAELGQISGTEDDLVVAENDARLTDPAQAVEFVNETGLDALAVCIGNVHGQYRGEPQLDLARLAEIRRRVSVPLVLHGASGLKEQHIREAIRLGVCKFNVNTELRQAYLTAARSALTGAKPADLSDLIAAVVAAVKTVVLDKLRLFASGGKA
ncbi:MAG: class II fructose-bisphosphate aldolase [Chloroflexi bacterium]|nr:class II fructose-bisphosphate aldolase [Chloroflexota bacterium]